MYYKRGRLESIECINKNEKYGDDFILLAF